MFYTGVYLYLTMIYLHFVYLHRAVLAHGHDGQLPEGPKITGTHANLCMLRTAFFLMFKH
jgi:hypothetical protein